MELHDSLRPRFQDLARLRPRCTAHRKVKAESEACYRSPGACRWGMGDLFGMGGARLLGWAGGRRSAVSAEPGKLVDPRVNFRGDGEAI
ncbi:hypothetical protein AAFF_G00327740 [Aldrovandia affinis]|uniref:Uncharacterized protein n=1 Tax=Aldrovandia affinis TaxID=143900 RepID=A0AAD7T9I8_9TELE|nr:hypothetical protein AAFF_G00327740 [Aldrovandia affinis]